MTRALHIAILVFDGVEALDLAGPYEVFSTAARMAKRMAVQSTDAPNPAAHWQISCVARNAQPVTARAGMRIAPTCDFSHCDEVDVLIVPGGVVDAASQCAETLAWVQAVSATAQITASVCTGVFVLAAAGVMHNQSVTTHWEDVADLRQKYPGLQVQEGVRWVEAEHSHGYLITSAGISAGIDMSLRLVERLAGATLAARTALEMDYRWLRNPQ